MLTAHSDQPRGASARPHSEVQSELMVAVALGMNLHNHAITQLAHQVDSVQLGDVEPEVICAENAESEVHS
jgi:hypothetical protein